MGRRVLTKTVVLGFLGGVLCAPDLHAQGLDGERFVPAAGAAGGVVVERPFVPRHLGYGLGLFLNYADDAVVRRDRTTGAQIGTPLDSAVSADLLASLGLFDRAEIALALPLRLVYEGDASNVAGVPLDAGTGVGDVRVLPKLELTRSALGDAAVGHSLAVAVPVTFPTGRARALRGAGTLTIEPRLLFALFVERWLLAASGGFRFRDAEGGLGPGHEITVGVGGTYALVPERPWVDLHLEAVGGWIPGLEGRSLVDMPLEVLAAVILGPFPRWSFYGGAGAGVTNGIAVPDVRVFLGARYAVGAPARGGARDSDGDGIPDSEDRCPQQPEDLDAFEDDDGCPEADNDRDGIPDDDDECPDDAEEPGGDRDGCPDRGKVVVRRGKLVVFGKIQFATGSEQILPKSEQLVDEMAAALRDHPQFRRVEIQGHTDSAGEADYNLKLSERRAESVKRALVRRGVAADRLVPKGHGEDQPIAPNETRAGRAKNRRVEFAVLD